MMQFNQISALLGINIVLLIFLLFVLIAWETAWKGIGMWRSARNKQLPWFVCILVFNTIGILPIIYIYFFQKRRK